ncbi:MAG: glycerophosphodiester phosphodiesterase [Paracoccus sp. (in: a-proteobacteria)]|nr:glycerophosphodiester phosphodiesterase [Paracoccus sp. (in: a-proteobacteria)]
MGDPRFIHGPDGRKVWLKWHRARRVSTDPEFSPARIREGMKAGARIEVDLVPCADGFAVLHDDTLDRSTSGRGLVADHAAGSLSGLFLRGPDGSITSERVMTLGDLCVLAAGQAGIGAQIQLDLKVGRAALVPAVTAGFAQAVEPVAERLILSGGDSAAVAYLGDMVPRLPLGHDPCHGGTVARLMERRDFDGFVCGAVGDAGRARMIYLEHGLILFADDRGFDLIGALHEAGFEVDAYTIPRAAPPYLDAISRLLGLGVDQITTDDPQSLLDWAGAASSESLARPSRSQS